MWMDQMCEQQMLAINTPSILSSAVTWDDVSNSWYLWRALQVTKHFGWDCSIYTRNILKGKEMEPRKKRDLPKVRAPMLHGNGQFCALCHHMPPPLPHTAHLPSPFQNGFAGPLSPCICKTWKFSQILPLDCQFLRGFILCLEGHCCAASLGTRLAGK